MADAFISAGAATVISAAWALDDAQTTQFMLDFYRRLLDGLDPGGALNAVQSAWSQSGAHPRLWAAYNVLSRPGEWTLSKEKVRA